MAPKCGKCCCAPLSMVGLLRSEFAKFLLGHVTLANKLSSSFDVEPALLQDLGFQSLVVRFVLGSFVPDRIAFHDDIRRSLDTASALTKEFFLQFSVALHNAFKFSVALHNSLDKSVENEEGTSDQNHCDGQR